MKARNADSRRRLAVAAGTWAVLIGFLIAAGASLGGLATADVLETAVLGGLGAAICIWFFAGDILAVADRLHWPRRPTPK
jgi:hypothetical protein